MKKIVITGGLGYIGTELCRIYSGYSWNYKVTVIDEDKFKLSNAGTATSISSTNYNRKIYVKLSSML